MRIEPQNSAAVSVWIVDQAAVCVTHQCIVAHLQHCRKLPVEAYCDSFVISLVVGLLKVTLLKAIGVIRLWYKLDNV